MLFSKAIASERPPHCDSLDALLLVLERLGTSLEKLDASHQGRLQPTRNQVKVVAEQLSSMMLDDQQSAGDRLAAARTLSRLEPYRTQALEHLATALSPNVPPELQSLALRTLSQSADSSVPTKLAQAWKTLTPALRVQAIDVWTSRSTSLSDLLDRIEKGEIMPGSLDLTQRNFLARYPDAKLAARAQSLLAQSEQSSKRQAVLDSYRPALSLDADAKRGLQVYQRACANCHRRGTSGIEVGPNLATVVSHSKEKLLRNIVDPNIDIQPGYQAYTCLLDTGEVLSGLLTEETSISLSIKAAGGAVRTVTRSEIEKLQNLNVSLMPEGMETSISVQEMADLLSYLVGAVE